MMKTDFVRLTQLEGNETQTSKMPSSIRFCNPESSAPDEAHATCVPAPFVLPHSAYTRRMNFADLLTLANRGLRRRPVRTLLTVLGIVVAVASMVIFLSLGEGFRRALGQEIGNVGPDIQVTLEGSDNSNVFGSPIPDVPFDVVTRLEGSAKALGVKQVIPYILTARGGFSGQGYLIAGYPFERVPLNDIYPNLKLAANGGRLFSSADATANVAVVGSQAAKSASLKLGDELRLNRETRLRVVGILEKSDGFTDSFVFVPFGALANGLGVTGRATGVALKLEDAGSARKIADEIKRRFPDLNARTQGDVISILDRAIAIGDAFRFGISLISLIVGGLAVANTVMMGVYERTREFGVIRAIGAKPSFVFQLVVLESMLLAVIGGAGGVVLGYIGTLVVNFAVRDLISIAIAAVTVRLVLLAVGVAAVLGLISGLLPARVASRLVITEALGRN
jgi:putative ABC transport system permease protein